MSYVKVIGKLSSSATKRIVAQQQRRDKAETQHKPFNQPFATLRRMLAERAHGNR